MKLPPAFPLALSAMAHAAVGASEDLQERAGTFVFWAVALDERLGALNGEAYKGHRNCDPGGRLLLPMKFARNALAHGSIVAVRRGGVTYPLSYPFSIPSATWRPLDELRDEWPERIHPGNHAEMAYGNLLAGNPVMPCFPLVRAWFEQLIPA